MRLLFYTLIILFVNSNNANSQDSTNYYGEEFSTLDVKDYSTNKQGFLYNTKDLIKIEAEILSTCPKKGCWMKIKAEEDTILVRFKDYGFFVPKDGVVGNMTVINGKLSVDTLSVAQLRHYAEDAGKSKEEINKIMNPEISMTFLANGVMIRED
tara:strand:+ start:1793 stop:2254 length:462 start_codon:yes stop_codon:yes gene_type:complete